MNNMGSKIASTKNFWTLHMVGGPHLWLRTPLGSPQQSIRLYDMTQRSHSSRSITHFHILFFLICMHFLTFSILLHWLEFPILCCVSGQSGHSCLIPNHKRKLSSFRILAVGFFSVLYQFKEVSLYSNFSDFFYHKLFFYFSRFLRWNLRLILDFHFSIIWI